VVIKENGVTYCGSLHHDIIGAGNSGSRDLKIRVVVPFKTKVTAEFGYIRRSDMKELLHRHEEDAPRCCDAQCHKKIGVKKKLRYINPKSRMNPLILHNHCSFRNNPEQCSSHLLQGGSLKSLTLQINKISRHF
jgi:hypothetical protein